MYLFLFIYLFIIAPSIQFPRAEISNYRNYVRNGYDARSELRTCQLSCRVEALNGDRQALE